MKKLLLTAILIVSFCAISAQSPVPINPYPFNEKGTVLDSARYLFKYKLSCVNDLTQKDTIKNTFALLVGNACSKFFDYIYLDSTYIKRCIKYSFMINKNGDGLAATEIYKNNKDGKMTVTVMLPPTTSYIYEENMTPPVWKIEKEKKQLLGYACQQATTTYLGRQYTAWFCADIPIADGPWKFSGLPGLILQVYDSKNEYFFNCVGIKTLQQPLPIVRYKASYIKTNRMEMNKILMNLHTSFIQTIQASLSPNMAMAFSGIPGYDKPITISNTQSSIPSISFPYNPIELK